MGKRYIQVPGPASLLDDRGNTHLFSWSDAMRSLFRDPQFLQLMDYDDRGRLREAVLSASKGDVLELDDEQWAKLAQVAKRPQSLHPDFLDEPTGVAMLDAIRNAQTKHPNDKQPKGPKKD